EALGDLIPVYHIPPGRDIVSPEVLVLQIIGVLPNVDAENRRLPLRKRRVLVSRGRDGKVAVLINDQPAPAAPEMTGCLAAELLLELIERAERLVDGLGERAARLPTPVRAHDGPEQRVIRVAATVVADRRPDLLRHRVEVAHQLLDALRLQVRVALKRLVHVVHISLVMLVMVDPHRLLIDMRLQRVVSIRQRWKFVSHYSSSFE